MLPSEAADFSLEKIFRRSCVVLLCIMFGKGFGLCIIRTVTTRTCTYKYMYIHVYMHIQCVSTMLFIVTNRVF